MRPRILMIGPYPEDPSRINGGVASALMYLSEALTNAGDVELIGVRLSKRPFQANVRKGFAWKMRDLPLGRLSLASLYGRQVRQIRQLVDEIQPQIVHAQGADIAGFVAARSGIPFVITVHGLLLECAKLNSDPVDRFRSMLAAHLTERSTIRRARDLIAISPYVRSYYEGDIRGRVYDIPNAVASQYFKVQRRPERGRFLYAGRISNGKGLLDLLKAIQRLQTAEPRLILAGATPDPNYERKLRVFVDQANLRENVRFEGLLDEGALLREFERAECLVLPSYQETAPMVVQQAMAAGLPVIATRVGGIPHQIDHGLTGLIFNPGDGDSLCALMADVTQSPELAHRLSAAAKRAANVRYRARAIADATTHVYRTMLDDNRSTALA